ncbi:hypothetical protein BT67DRAFT_432111 [Trichocladium antarcticum]|uniref:Uncharacterized protein n=1 Tax=Trichocladium antarcticum TaxID=1450529 RepID=A0AAN6ZG67_9PEZI|nr:hypothetical protein BT67DRAFT_432111 [Trichocladium antarcticum]
MYSGYIGKNNFNIYVASIVFVLNFKRLISIFTEGDNTSPAAAPAAAAPTAAAPAAAATAAAALAALAALPDLEPDPIYNIRKFPYRSRRRLVILILYKSLYNKVRDYYIIIGICNIQSYAPNPRAPNPRAPNLHAPNPRALN